MPGLQYPFWPTAHSGDGGFGGNGGYGGKGGGGGAGAGGPAVGLLQTGTGSGYVAQQGTTETPGQAGGAGRQGNTSLVGEGGQSVGILRSVRAPSTSTADFDGDGIADRVDLCPGASAPRTTDGCVVRPAKLTDRDGDGVPDARDACGDVAAGATDLDLDGCADPVVTDTKRDPVLSESQGNPAKQGNPANQPAPGATPPSGAGSPAVQRITFGLSFSVAKQTKRSTTLRDARVTGLPAGSTLTVSCVTRKGKRCVGTPAIVKQSVSGVVRLQSWVIRPLPVGTRLSISVVKTGAIGARKTLTVKARARPSVATACLAPGSAQPAGC